MGLFSSKKVNIYAPFDCEVIDIEKVNDPTFSQKTVGEGIAVIPRDDVDTVFSPVDGSVTKVFKTKHAVSFIVDGLELFIHVGLETVTLKGEGFEVLTEAKKDVLHTNPILKIDLNIIKEKAKSTETPIVISNSEKIKSIKKNLGLKSTGDIIAVVSVK